MIRAALAALLALRPVATAAEPAPVERLLSQSVPQDRAAKGERLAKLQSDLAIAAEGLEGFANDADAEPSLARLRESVDSNADAQFKDRRAALDAAYRALAVVDYTWALRLPHEGCPTARNARVLLLRSGGLSAWLKSQLGADADEKVAEALDRASSAQGAMSAREYARLRARAKLITRALESDKAEGVQRGDLHCRRAQAYEALAAANRDAALVSAARNWDDGSGGVYVLARKTEGGLDVLGAATAVEGALVTDSRLVEGAGLVVLRRGDKKLLPVTVARRSGPLALLKTAAAVQGYALAPTTPAKDDLVRGVGHVDGLGAWTETRGLVTSSDGNYFQTDAVVAPGMAGGAILDEEGRLAGVLVLRSLTAGPESFEWPVAVSAPALKAWLAGGETPAFASLALADAGTSSILTASRALGPSLEPGGAATEAGLRMTEDHGSYGVIHMSCPTCPDGSGSSGGGSDYDTSGAGELGKMMGQAMAQMIFKGVPALFRGIGSLFKSKPKSGTAYASEPPEREAPTAKPKPKPELKVRLAATQDQEGQYVFTATVTSTDPEQLPVGGQNVNFTVNGTAASAKTDASGVAILYVDVPPPSVAAHKGLDEESAKHPWLTETGRRTIGENVCLAALGATVLTLEVTVVVVATAGGGPVGGTATTALCVKANPAIVAGALAVCALAKGAEVAANKSADRQAAQRVPARAPIDKIKVNVASEKQHDDLDAEARKYENSGAQPGNPDEDPDEPGNSEQPSKSDSKWNGSKSLKRHFRDHGKDFDAKSENEYARMANDFFENAESRQLPRKIEMNGNIRIYDPKTNTFGSYKPDGTPRTFYKPDPKVHGLPTNEDYWIAQPGALQ